MGTEYVYGDELERTDRGEHLHIAVTRMMSNPLVEAHSIRCVISMDVSKQMRPVIGKPHCRVYQSFPQVAGHWGIMSKGEDALLKVRRNYSRQT